MNSRVLFLGIGVSSATWLMGCGGDDTSTTLVVPDSGADVVIADTSPGADTSPPADASTYQVDFTVQPTSGYSLVQLGSISVRVRDQNAQPVTTPVPVTLTLVAGPGAIGGTTTAMTSNGVATFADITISKAGLYEVVATAGAFTAKSNKLPIDAWQPWSGSLYGGTIRRMVVDPTDDKTAYAGTDTGGLYQTTDGATWHLSGFVGNSVYGIAVDPTKATTVYAGNGQSGVFKSLDKGVTWAAANAGISSTFVTAIVIDPSNTQTLYTTPTGMGVMKSTDGGGTWNPASDLAFAKSSMYTVAVAPKDPQTLYTQAYNQQIYKSADGGKTWTPMTGLPANVGVATIATDPTDQTNVFVGLGETSPGIWHSTGGGAFTKVAGVNIAQISTETLVFVPGGNQTLYACAYGSAIWKSTDGGGTWVDTKDNLHGGNAMLAMGLSASSTNTLYVGHYLISGGGISKTTTGGTTWADASQGFTAFSVNGVAIDPNNSMNVWVGGGYNGLNYSTDGGKTYSAISVQQGLTWGGDFTVKIGPTGTIYAGNNGGAVFKSTNNGATFVHDAVLGNGNVTQVSLSPADANTVYVGGNIGLAGTSSGGMAWSLLTGNPYSNVWGIAAHPTTANTAYAGLSDGVYRTVTSGQSWTKVTNKVAGTVLAFDSKANIFAGAGTLQSSPDGNTWSDVTGALPLDSNHFATALAIFSIKGKDVIFASSTGLGAWRNDGSGFITTGMANRAVLSFAQDPKSASTIYAGARASGLYRSISGGE